MFTRECIESASIWYFRTNPEFEWSEVLSKSRWKRIVETFLRWLRNGGGLKRLSKYRSKFVNDLAENRIKWTKEKRVQANSRSVSWEVVEGVLRWIVDVAHNRVQFRGIDEMIYVKWWTVFVRLLFLRLPRPNYLQYSEWHFFKRSIVIFDEWIPKRRINFLSSEMGIICMCKIVQKYSIYYQHIILKSKKSEVPSFSACHLCFSSACF